MGGGFAHGEVALLVAEVSQAGLQVQGDRVVDLAADFLFGQVVAEFVAAGSADDVLMKDVSGARVGDGENDSFLYSVGGEIGFAEELIVDECVFAALLIPLGQIAEFDLEDCGLDGVKARVPADLVVIVAAAHAVGAEDAGVVVDRRGSGGDEAGVSHGA